jgi:hypothetical protein
METTTESTPHERAEKLMEPFWAAGIPSYGEHEDLPEGLYLGLMHGYANDFDRREGDDWGINGPIIGPLEYVHTTYATRVGIEFFDRERAQLYFGEKSYCEAELDILRNNCLYFGGVEFGDWTVFYHKPGVSP